MPEHARSLTAVAPIVAYDRSISDWPESASFAPRRVAEVTVLRPRRQRPIGEPRRSPWHVVRPRSRKQRTITQSTKLRDVLYEIRGPLHDHAARLEAQGHRILKLNIGNPAPFGFDAPDEIVRDIIHALPTAQGYSDSKGILSARRAVVANYETVPNFPRFDVDDVYLGNGVSELITMTLQALLDDGDQVLVPAPNYPLWTAATSLAGGPPCITCATRWPVGSPTSRISRPRSPVVRRRSL